MTGGTAGPGVPQGAVILAGGQGRRLGGRDKPALIIGGQSLLDRALEAVPGATVVVVGPTRRLPPGVRRVFENPPGGGPAAALAAGMAALPTLSDDAVVAVLAADLPGIGPGTVGRLCAALLGADPALAAGVRAPSAETPTLAAQDRALSTGDLSLPTGNQVASAADPVARGVPGGAVLLDVHGRRQYLIGAWRYGALQAAIDHRGTWHDAALRDLLATIPVIEVAGSDRESDDIDTPADLTRWRD